MSLAITETEYKAISDLISSETSVVGIDAKKTHILIIHQLMQMERRMAMLEQTLKELQAKDN